MLSGETQCSPAIRLELPADDFTFIEGRLHLCIYILDSSISRSKQAILSRCRVRAIYVHFIQCYIHDEETGVP
jgi:hypothetical protein